VRLFSWVFHRQHVARILVLPLRTHTHTHTHTHVLVLGSPKHPRNVKQVDGELDAASSNPGQQRLEKLIGGMYMGEVCRLALNRMVKAGEFSCPVGEGGQGLVKKSSEDMARILEFGG
jgi:hexokinase